MADTLFDGRAFRILTVVDCHTRESLTIMPRSRFRPPHVVDALDVRERPRDDPLRQRSGVRRTAAGPVVYFNRVGLDVSRPPTPTDKAFIESLQVRSRQECLNA